MIIFGFIDATVTTVVYAMLIVILAVVSALSLLLSLLLVNDAKRFMSSLSNFATCMSKEIKNV